MIYDWLHGYILDLCDIEKKSILSQKDAVTHDVSAALVLSEMLNYTVTKKVNVFNEVYLLLWAITVEMPEKNKSTLRKIHRTKKLNYWC